MKTLARVGNHQPRNVAAKQLRKKSSFDRGVDALLSKLLELLGFLHQIRSKCLKLVRGGRMRAVSREANETKSKLPKIFDDVRTHECVTNSTTSGH